MSAADSNDLNITIKGPDTKLALVVPPTANVLELKNLVFAAAPNFPVDQQRLIYSGRVLKDEDLVSKYSLKTGHVVHLVKGAAPAAAPATVVPQNFAAGQQIAGNPLAPLLNAQNAGALAGFNPFAAMGINTNDPNYMQTMMNDPAVQTNMANMLADPAVVDQVIASNPQLASMGPQVRQLMQSEQFRSFLTNPESMRQMMAMGGGMGAGGAGGFPSFGQDPAAAAGAPATGPTNLFNPWASNPPADATGATGAAGGQPPAFNPFGGAGGAPDMAQMMRQMEQMRAMGFGGPGGFGGAPALPPAPVANPEERYQVQLEQLSGMGFYDAAKNVRALQAAGGNVEAAVEWLFSN